MPDTYAAEPRSVLGKAVSKLRRGGVLPANIYGRGLESTAVQLPAREARTLLRDHGTNTLINLQVAGESRPRSVVVRKVQRHPVSHDLQHLDFYQVDLARPIQGQVSVTLVGEAPAVHTYRGVLLQGADSVLIEALPAEMPTHLEVSVEGLTELDTSVTVADLTLPPGVTVLSPPDLVLAQVARPRISAAEAAEGLPEGEQEAEEGVTAEAAAGETSGGAATQESGES